VEAENKASSELSIKLMPDLTTKFMSCKSQDSALLLSYVLCWNTERQSLTDLCSSFGYMSQYLTAVFIGSNSFLIW